MQASRFQSLGLGFELGCIAVSLSKTNMTWYTYNYVASLMAYSPSPGETVVMSDMLSRVRNACDKYLRLRSFESIGT